jgi:hypothetical protein
MVRADVVTQTLSFNLFINNSTNLNINPSIIATTLTFGQFNPALGTLTDVQYLLLNSMETRNLEVTGRRNSGAVNSSSVGTTTGFASLVGAPLVPVFLQTILASCSGNPSCSSTQTASSSLAGSTSIAALASYIGMGTVDAILTLTAGRTPPVGTPLFAAGLNRTANIDASWTGDVQLIYTYTPAPVSAVPEPTTWAMLGLSGLAFAARARFRKR